MNKKKSILLLSGGLDSAVNLSIAMQQRTVKLCLTFDYGQKSAKQEIKAAEQLASFYKIPHQLIKTGWLKVITNTALVNPAKKIPTIKSTDFSGPKNFKETAKQVWVPNRNGVFINIAAAFAESLQCDTIIVGFNKEEAVTFPDNSIPFLKAINQSLTFSTLTKVKVESFIKNFDKKAIVKKGISTKLPFELVYSCYLGTKKMCGKCESCARMLRAFKLLDKEELIKNNFA